MLRRIIVVVIVVILLLFVVNVVTSSAATEHCPDHNGHPGKVEGNYDSLVLDSGTEFCVKAGPYATGILVADGATTLTEYVESAGITVGNGNVPGVSYYVDYATVKPTPTPTDEPTETETPTESETPVETETPTESETTPSAYPPNTVTRTEVPTETATDIPRSDCEGDGTCDDSCSPPVRDDCEIEVPAENTTESEELTELAHTGSTARTLEWIIASSFLMAVGFRLLRRNYS